MAAAAGGTAVAEMGEGRVRGEASRGREMDSAKELVSEIKKLVMKN